MKHRLTRFGAAFVVAILALAPVAAALAQDQQPPGKTTLTGQLNTDEQGGYVLIERESGDQVALEASMDLSRYVGSTVKVTGQWAKDEEGHKHFKVSKVDRSP